MKQISQLQHPHVWQQLQWILNPVRFMEDAARKNPDIFATGLVEPWKNLIFVNHPEGIRQIFTGDPKQFNVLSKTNQTLAPILREHSILISEGEAHRKRRKLLIPPFHGERMRLYGNLIWELTEKIMDQVPIGQSFSASHVIQNISLETILTVVFGLDAGERAQKLRVLLTQATRLFTSGMTSTILFFPLLRRDLGNWSPWSRFLRLRHQIDLLLYELIAERRTYPDPERTDILSLLISIKDEEGQPMQKEELRDELMTLLFVGHETTTYAISWGLYCIHRHKEVKEKLLKELKTLGDSPKLTEIVLLPYLTAVCQETLRFRPVIINTLPRIVQEPVNLMGYELKPNAVVVGCIYLLHQREDLYSDPQAFKPERFLERSYSAYEFIPFGGGSRRCIGEALAFYEMKLVLAKILSSYHLELTDSQAETPKRRNITLAPSRGVRLIRL